MRVKLTSEPPGQKESHFSACDSKITMDTYIYM